MPVVTGNSENLATIMKEELKHGHESPVEVHSALRFGLLVPAQPMVGAGEQQLPVGTKANGMNLNFATIPSVDDEYGYQKKKTARDPMSHRIIEKRRRDRMNNCLADLSRLIPSGYLKKGRGRIEKTEIIEMAIKHLKHLQAHACKQMQNCELARKVDNMSNNVDQFRVGYQSCLREALHFLVEEEGLYSHKAVFRLMQHLQKHCEQVVTNLENSNDGDNISTGVSVGDILAESSNPPIDMVMKDGELTRPMGNGFMGDDTLSGGFQSTSTFSSSTQLNQACGKEDDESSCIMTVGSPPSNIFSNGSLFNCSGPSHIMVETKPADEETSPPSPSMSPPSSHHLSSMSFTPINCESQHEFQEAAIPLNREANGEGENVVLDLASHERHDWEKRDPAVTAQPQLVVIPSQEEMPPHPFGLVIKNPPRPEEATTHQEFTPVIQYTENGGHFSQALVREKERERIERERLDREVCWKLPEKVPLLVRDRSPSRDRDEILLERLRDRQFSTDFDFDNDRFLARRGSVGSDPRRELHCRDRFNKINRDGKILASVLEDKRDFVGGETSQLREMLQNPTPRTSHLNTNSGPLERVRAGSFSTGMTSRYSSIAGGISRNGVGFKPDEVYKFKRNIKERFKADLQLNKIAPHQDEARAEERPVDTQRDATNGNNNGAESSHICTGSESPLDSEGSSNRNDGTSVSNGVSSNSSSDNDNDKMALDNGNDDSDSDQLLTLQPGHHRHHYHARRHRGHRDEYMIRIDQQGEAVNQKPSEGSSGYQSSGEASSLRTGSSSSRTSSCITVPVGLDGNGNGSNDDSSCEDQKNDHCLSTTSSGPTFYHQSTLETVNTECVPSYPRLSYPRVESPIPAPYLLHEPSTLTISTSLSPNNRSTTFQASVTQRGIPIFALHPRGAFYIPLMLDASILLPYLAQLGEIGSPPLHHIGIDVFYCTPIVKDIKRDSDTSSALISPHSPHVSAFQATRSSHSFLTMPILKVPDTVEGSTVPPPTSATSPVHYHSDFLLNRTELMVK